MAVRPRSFFAFVAGLLLLAASSPARADGSGGGLAVYLFAGHSGWDTTALDARLTSLGYGAFSRIRAAAVSACARGSTVAASASSTWSSSSPTPAWPRTAVGSSR